MAIAADVRRDGAPEVVERKPGQFARAVDTGAPWVNHPTEFAKSWGLAKADLIVECSRRGIEVPPKATVKAIEALLGPKPKRVMYGRPSSLGKQIENQTNLQKWSERAVALGLFLSTYGEDHDGYDRAEHLIVGDLYELDRSQLNLDDKDAREILDAIAVKAKNLAQAGIAAERGTHGHELTEKVDEELDWIEAANRGEDLGLPLEVQEALVAAWSRMLEEFDIEILAVEATCVDDVWRQAGTLDRICRLRRDTRFVTVTGEVVVLPAGWVGILDIKTGKLRLDRFGFVSYWHGYAVQLASYAQSVPYDVDADVRSTWAEALAPLVIPCANCGETDDHTCHLDGEEYGPSTEPVAIDQRWAIIAHLDILAALDGEAKCRLVLVDLEAGRAAGALCVAAREWEKRTDVFSIPTDDLMVSVPVSSAPPAEEPAPGANGTPDEQAAEAPNTSAEIAGPPTSTTTGEVPPASPVVDRREQLLARFKALGDTDRAAFRALAIPADDLDRIERALDELETPAPSPLRQMQADAAEARQAHARPILADVVPADCAEGTWGGPVFEGDEGEAIPERVRDDMRTVIESLDVDARATLNVIAGRAHRTVGSIAMAAKPCRRRWEIARALVGMARYGWDDDLVRASLALVTGDDACHQPGIDLGVIVGLLTLDQAIAWGDLTASIAGGGHTPDASSGRWQWVPAAAA